MCACWVCHGCCPTGNATLLFPVPCWLLSASSSLHRNHNHHRNPDWWAVMSTKGRQYKVLEQPAWTNSACGNRAAKSCHVSSDMYQYSKTAFVFLPGSWALWYPGWELEIEIIQMLPRPYLVPQMLCEPFRSWFSHQAVSTCTPGVGLLHGVLPSRSPCENLCLAAWTVDLQNS